MVDAPSHQRGLGTTPTPANPRTGTLEQELSLSLSSHHRLCKRSAKSNRIKKAGSLKRSQIDPFCSTGLRPVAPPCSLLHPSSRRFEKGLVRGRSSSLTASYRASTNPERAAPPLPLLTKRDDHQAGDSGGRKSGGRFLPGPCRSLCCSYPTSFTRPAEIVAAR